MKTLKILSFISLIFGIASEACEPPPALNSECKYGIFQSYHDDSTQKLYAEVNSYYQLLKKEIKEKKPSVFKARYGDGSCYLFNFAHDHLKELKDFAKSNRGEICSQDVSIIESEVKKLIDLKAEELKDIESKELKRKLKKLRQSINELLPVFTKHHSKSKLKK